MSEGQDELHAWREGELHHAVWSSSWRRHLRAPGPWVVLALSLAISAFAGYITQREVEAEQRARFARQADNLVAAIDARLGAYRSVLLGGAALFHAAELVTREEWRAYTRRLRLDELYPGIQGLGFAEILRPADVAVFEAAVRAEGFPAFRVQPEGRRETVAAIKYLEPFDWRNRRAFGYDMFSEPVRREAMERARDEGDAAISGRVTLVQETEADRQAGFLMYVPVYRAHADTDTVEERRRAIVGYVYSPFRANDLMAGVLGKGLPRVSFRLFDGPAGPAERLLYDSAAGVGPALRPRFSELRQIAVGGRTWQLRVESTPVFEASVANHASWVVFGAGSVDGLLLFAMSLAFLAARDDARRAARLLAQKVAAEQRYRVLVDAMPTALLAVNEGGVIEQANAQAAELFGYAKETLVGMQVESLLPSQHRNAHGGHRANYLAEPRNRLMGGGRELHAQTRSGELVPVEIGLSPLVTDTGVLVLATVADIRERIKGRREVESLMERLTQKNREMEQFVYTVSHDLKAPLVTIAGFSRQLERSLRDGLDERQRHWLARIQANVHSMEALLGDLLHLSRIIHRQMERAPVDANRAMAEAVNALAGAIQEAGAKIEVQASLPPVHAQERLVVQCFQNLLANAIKYRKDAEPPSIRVTGAEEGAWIHYRVEDNGIGIEPRHQARVFQIFERLDPERTEGTGVGLAIVKTIMEKHGGKVSVESEPGVGSCFSLFFPRVEPAASS